MIEKELNMKTVLTILLVISVTFAVGDSDRGITSAGGDDVLQVNPYGDIETNETSLEKRVLTHERPKAYTSLVDSVFFKIALRPGEWYAVYVDVPAGTLGTYSGPDYSGIDSLLIPWIESAPTFLQDQLRLNLEGLSTYMAEYYDIMLSEADPLWLDELFYCLANMAPFILEQAEMSYLLLENVQYMYMADSFLNYVEIVDYGTPGGPDHYSTTRYATTDSNLATFETIEIDRDIYYKHVMFPKTSDEQPAYIYPITGDMVDPWSGEFWRSYFWDVADTVGDFECWALGDSLMTTDYLWKGRFNNITDNGALGIAMQWIENCLVFDSDAERPVQPVRIYAKHKGRCGEHSDMRTAACRTGLIPCVNTESISTDHVWNEFYNGYRWSALDGGNVDNSWLYADGWGKNFGTVYHHTSKSWHDPVTQRYSHEIATIDITVRDNILKPIDGAQVLVAMEAWTYGDTLIYYDCILHTDSRGQCRTLVGDERKFFYRAETAIGMHPGPGYVNSLVTNTLDGENYNRFITISNNLAYYSWSEETPVEEPAGYLGARIRPLGEFIKYTAPFMDIDCDFIEWVEGDAYGFSIIALSDSQFAYFSDDTAFQALALLDECDYGSIEAPVGNSPHWLVIANYNNVANTLVGELAVMLHDSSTSVDESEKPEAIALNIYPNPFNSALSIDITGFGDDIRLEIFDISGRLVDIIQPDPQLDRIVWRPSETTATGVYWVRACSGDMQKTVKAVYLK